MRTLHSILSKITTSFLSLVFLKPKLLFTMCLSFLYIFSLRGQTLISYQGFEQDALDTVFAEMVMPTYYPHPRLWAYPEREKPLLTSLIAVSSHYA